MQLTKRPSKPVIFVHCAWTLGRAIKKEKEIKMREFGFIERSPLSHQRCFAALALSRYEFMILVNRNNPANPKKNLSRILIVVPKTPLPKIM